MHEGPPTRLHDPHRRHESAKVTHYIGGTKRAFVNDRSPHGRQIVYHVVGDAVNDLYVVNADGTNTHALTHLGPGANPRHSVWGTAD